MVVDPKLCSCGSLFIYAGFKDQHMMTDGADDDCSFTFTYCGLISGDDDLMAQYLPLFFLSMATTVVKLDKSEN